MSGRLSGLQSQLTDSNLKCNGDRGESGMDPRDRWITTGFQERVRKVGPPEFPSWSSADACHRVSFGGIKNDTSKSTLLTSMLVHRIPPSPNSLI
jgi:hypothetical protein